VAHWLEESINNLNINKLNVEIVDLKQWDLPLFSGAHSPASGIYDQPKQQEWANKISQGDAFIFISPEYNHGYSPALKNALDYLAKEWKNKPAAFVSYGGTFGSRSIDQIKQVCTYMGMIDSDAVLQIRDIFQRNKTDQFDGTEFDVKALKSLVEKLVHFIQLK